MSTLTYCIFLSHGVLVSSMPTEKPKIIIVLENDLIEKIEDFRFSNRISSRSKAIRQLLEKALKDYKTPPKPSK